MASPVPDAGRLRRSGLLAAPTVVVGLAFAAPLAYLAYRSAALGGDLAAELTSSSTWQPLQRTLVLAASAALVAAVLGTAMAWVTAHS